MNEFSDQKTALMQKKDLVHRLWILELPGTIKLTPKERSYLADMILKRKGKKPDLIQNIDDGIDLDNEGD